MPRHNPIFFIALASITIIDFKCDRPAYRSYYGVYQIGKEEEILVNVVLRDYCPTCQTLYFSDESLRVVLFAQTLPVILDFSSRGSVGRLWQSTGGYRV